MANLRNCLLLFSFGVFYASGNSWGASLTLDKAVEIPEATLQPGQYQIALEDRLKDRAIVRITGTDANPHFVLAMPRPLSDAGQSELVYFPKASAIEAWRCPRCRQPLEFVYPKDEAVRLISETGKPVLAFDPLYDKLPDSLSAADRKVVTLWMLSPKEMASGGSAPAVAAQKLTTPVSSASAQLPHRMPKTASYAVGELGIGFLLLGAAAIRASRKRALPEV